MANKFEVLFEGVRIRIPHPTFPNPDFHPKNQEIVAFLNIY